MVVHEGRPQPTVTVEAHDGASLRGYRWLPEDEPRAIVQIAHGMAEHAARYDAFARDLTAAGYVVYANDHRGHGLTAAPADRGYFADVHGWETVVDDLALFTAQARADFPDLPVVLFGHSMGSLLARTYITRYGDGLAAVILSGTATDPGALGKAGQVIAALESRLRGRRHPSRLMTNLTFGPYNAKFKPARTEFDWLSRDETQVDRYVADPLCGQTFTSGFYVDLLGGLAELQRDAVVVGTPTSLPMLIIAGADDPVGGSKVTEVGAQLERLGVADVTVKTYPEARHEILNEINRAEVVDDVLSWMDARLTR